MWKRKTALFCAAILVFGLAFVYLVPGRTAATTGINQELSFEGKIVNASGINIPDGTYNMEFKIYAGGTATGGGTLDWTEDYLVSGTGGVTFSSGTFQVNLGSVNAFGGSINWNTYPLYLSLQIGNTSSCTITTTFTSNCGGDGEMSPYILLTSTPYSLNSNELGGLTSSAYGQLAANQTWTGTNTIQPTTNITGEVVKQTSVGSPTADIFDVQTANGTSVIQVTGPSANNAAVSITSVGGSSGLTLQAGSGTVSLGSSTSLTANGPLSVSSGGTTQTLTLTTPASTSAATGAITIQSGNASSGSNLNAGTVTIDTGTSTGAGTAAINIGTANAKTLTLGNTTGTDSTTIQSGTGSVNINPAGGSSNVGVLVKPGSDTTKTFQVQNAAGTGLLTADTTDGTVSVGTVAGNGSFDAPYTLTTGTTPLSPAVGDFNGDSRNDLIVANGGTVSPGTASDFVNSGTNLPITATSTLSGNKTLAAIATGDFNGDGKTDAIGVGTVSAGLATVPIFINSGSALPTSVSYDVDDSSHPTAIATGDFNGDGKTDAVLADNASTASLFIDSGGVLPTNATTVLNTSGSASNGIAVGDFNGDGKPDLAIANSGGTVSIFINNGSSSAPFNTTATSTLTAGTTPVGIVAGDFNGDGKIDLAVANSGSNTISVYTNTGTALPTTASYTINTGTTPYGLATADFNGDGKPDLAVTNSGSASASVFINTGSALPTNATYTLATGTTPKGIVAADFNNDGKPDLAITNSASATASIFINTSVMAGRLTAVPANSNQIGLVVQGDSQFQASTNSTNVFQIQNAAGTSFLNADSTNMIISTKDQDVGSAVNVGGAGRLFSDGFESGNFNLWTSNNGMTIDSTNVRNGKYSAKYAPAGTTKYATANFTSSSTVYTRAYVDVSSSTSGNLDLIDVYGNSGGGAELYRDVSTGDICAWFNSAGNCSSTVLPLNQWHKLEMRITVGSPATVQIFYDDTLIYNNAAASGITTNLNILSIGEDSSSRTGTANIDDVSADTVPTGASSSLNVNDSLHVAGTASFGNAALFQDASNSTTAFQVQNASGTSALNVDTADLTTTLQAGTDTGTATELFTSAESFPATTGWGSISGTGSSATATHVTGITPLSPTPALGIVSTDTYQVSYTVTNPTPGSTLGVTMGGQSVASYTFDNNATTNGNVNNGTFSDSIFITASSSANLAFTPSSGTSFTGTISGVSVKLVTANTHPTLVVNNASGVDNLEVRSSSNVNNVFIGKAAGEFNSTGTYNLGLGTNALQINTSGYDNTALGNYTLQANTTGYNNTAVGLNALTANTSGVENTAVGKNTLFANTSGTVNTAVGGYALESNTTGTDNTAVGDAALLENTTGFWNTALGASALQDNTTGVQNIAIGIGSLQSNLTGGADVSTGSFALYNNGAGYNNTANGDSALNKNTSGDYNTALGSGALYYNQTGQANTAIGEGTLNTNVTGNDITVLGDDADVMQDGLSNATAIGADSLVGGNNNLILGCNNFIDNCPVANTNVGIGSDFAPNLLTTGAYTYNTGTIEQTGTAITGTGTAFATVGNTGTLYYADGTTATITYVDATHLTSSVTKSITSPQTYNIVWGGFNVTANGTAYLQPTGGDYTNAFQVINEYDTSSVLDVDTSNSRVGINTAAPDSSLSIANTDGSPAVLNAYVASATGLDYGVIQVSNAGGLTNPSARSLSLQPNGGDVCIGLTTDGSCDGALTIGGANSPTVFQVQNVSTTPLFTLDTSSMRVIVGSGTTGTSTPALLILDNKNTSGDPGTEVDGAMYYNTNTDNFRCGEAGVWQNCDGLLTSSSPGGSIASCTTACGAIATGTNVWPVSYCSAGHVVHVIASGTYSSASTAPTLAMNIYLGTNSSKGSDTLVGSAATAATAGASASNLGWSFDAYIYCASTTSVWGQGGAQIVTSTAGANARTQNSQSSATTITNQTQNIYIFPAWGTSSSSNKITCDEFIVQSL